MTARGVARCVLQCRPIKTKFAIRAAMVRSSQIGQCIPVPGPWVIWFCSLTFKSGLEGIRWRRLWSADFSAGDWDVCMDRHWLWFIRSILVFRGRIFWLRQMRFVNASMLYHIPLGIGSRLMGLGLFVLISAIGSN
jgi:hypothetical protein